MLLRRLALAATLVLSPLVAHAQGTLNFASTQPNAFNNGSYLVGPFDGTYTPPVGQASNISIFCVDILNYVSNGQTWSVNLTSLADNADHSNLRHPNNVTQYREAAWVSSYFSVAPQSLWGSMQYAMWGLLNPGSAPVDASSPSIIALADYAASQNFGAFTYMSQNYAAFDYSQYTVMTDVRSPGVADDNFVQEFITGDVPLTSTPEPATFALVGGGLLVVGGVVRRRRA